MMEVKGGVHINILRVKVKNTYKRRLREKGKQWVYMSEGVDAREKNDSNNVGKKTT